MKNTFHIYNGLRVYAIVIFDKYPEWRVLITDLNSRWDGGYGKEKKTKESVSGLAFNNKGEFETGVSFDLPLKYKEIDYLLPYKESKSILRLNLVKDKLPITKEDILNSDLEQTALEIEDICYSERSDSDVGYEIRDLLHKKE